MDDWSAVLQWKSWSIGKFKGRVLVDFGQLNWFLPITFDHIEEAQAFCERLDAIADWDAMDVRTVNAIFADREFARRVHIPEALKPMMRKWQLTNDLYTEHRPGRR